MSKKTGYPVWFTLAVLLIVAVFALAVYFWTDIKATLPRLDALEASVVEIQNQMVTGEAPSQLEITLSYLRSETDRHQGFIEQQEQILIWIVGLIGAAATALLGFFGWKSKKDVEHLIEDQYSEEIKKQLKKALEVKIGTDDEIMYLRENVRRTKRMHEKHVLFIGQSDDSKIKTIHEWLHSRNICQSEFQIDDDSKAVDVLISGQDIIVYEVTTDQQELAKERYKKFAINCAKEIDCIFFTQAKLDSDILGFMHVTTVNFVSKLRETLYSLLSLQS